MFPSSYDRVTTCRMTSRKACSWIQSCRRFFAYRRYTAITDGQDRQMFVSQRDGLCSFLSMTQQPLVDQGLIITEALPLCSDTKTTLDEWSGRCRDFYPTKHNTHNGQTSTPPSGIRTRPIPGKDLPQTQALDRTATWIGVIYCYSYN